MFVGYTLEHAGDCYRMWNPKTNSVHESRDVIWLKRIYFEPIVTQGIEIPAPTEIVFDEETPTDIEAGEGTSASKISTTNALPEEENTNGSTATMVVTKSGIAVRPPQRYEEAASSYEIKLTRAEQTYFQATQRYPEEYPKEVAFVGAGIGGGFTSTNELHVMKYDEAMASADKEAFGKAIDEDYYYERMDEHKVFKAVPRKSVPKGQKIIDST
jgi:hypothetical protein